MTKLNMQFAMAKAAAHKARGFHQSNRSASIKVKETVCMAYAKGEINNYEEKVKAKSPSGQNP